jgi:aarF domain-containing kinase
MKSRATFSCTLVEHLTTSHRTPLTDEFEHRDFAAVGQALSIRPDLLPLAYLEELQTLQDRVPPFSNQEAKQLIQEGLGVPAETVFSELSPEPVAAASLGQVYKGKLRSTGEVVAVKVQRPGVLEEISRDLYVLRILAAAAMKLKIPHR